MSLILNGTTGISDVDGTAAAPALTGTDTNTGIFFPAADTIAFSEGGVESMRITSTGDVGIGTSSPARKLQVHEATAATNAYIQLSNAATGAASTDGFQLIVGTSGETILAQRENAEMQFWTNNTERASINSSGYFKQRANGGSYFSGLYNTIQNNNNVSGDGVLVIGNAGGSATNNTSSRFFTIADAAADRLFIYGNGNVVNLNNSYGALSDIKLKENIVDATPKLDKLNQIRIVNFNLIGEEQKQLGVIAQELEQIFPSMIDETPDRDAEGNILETKTKSVKYSVFVPMLIKAIQEQQALITALTTRITALEAA